MRIILAGAGGFLGQRVAARLLALGHTVVALCRPGSSPPPTGCDIRIFDGINPEAALRKQESIDATINAAVSYGRNGAFSDIAISNLAMPLCLMEAALSRGCRRWVEAGSYYTSATGDGPLPAYTLSKRQIMDWGRLASKRGLCFYTAELYHLYGPGDRDDKFIPALIKACLTGQRFELTTGNQVRDFIHVDDAADAMAFLATTCADPGFAVLQVGTGVPTQVRQLAELIRQLGGGGELVFGARKAMANDIAYAVADPSAMTRLGWRHSIDLKAGLARTLEASR